MALYLLRDWIFTSRFGGKTYFGLLELESSNPKLKVSPSECIRLLFFRDDVVLSWTLSSQVSLSSKLHGSEQVPQHPVSIGIKVQPEIIF